MPKRIQMSRQRPWRAENPDAVIVARPSKWGNPYTVTKTKYGYEVQGTMNLLGVHPTVRKARAHAVELFEIHTGPMGVHEYDRETRELLVAELRGRDLACWCPLNHPCHADVLLELANGGDR